MDNDLLTKPAQRGIGGSSPQASTAGESGGSSAQAGTAGDPGRRRRPLECGSMGRLVVKLGSSSIASGEGLALDVIADLVTQIAAAKRGGHQVILVTSGAARLGRRLPELESTLRRYNQARREGPLGVALAASA